MMRVNRLAALLLVVVGSTVPVGGGRCAAQTPRTYDLVVDAGGGGDHATLQAAVDALGPAGGSIFVKKGTYGLTQPVTISNVATGMLIQGEGEGTLFEAVGGGGFNMFEIHTSTDVVVRDLTVDGNKAVNFPSPNDPDKGNGVMTVYSVSCRLENLTARDCANYGVKLVHASGRSVVRGCTTEGNGGGSPGSDAGDGIQLYASTDCLVTANLSKGNHWSGIQLRRSGMTTVAGNTVLDNSQEAAGSWDGIRVEGVGADHSLSVAVTGNLVGNTAGNLTQGWGVFCDAYSDFNLITGNIFQGNASGSVHREGSNDVVRTNIPGSVFTGACDVNDDGEVDSSDIVEMIQCFDW